MSSDQQLRARIKGLLASAKLDTSIVSIRRCNPTGNNRTYEVSTGNATYAAKEYFRDHRDPRDRLAAEWALLSYAAQVTPGITPRPLAADEATGMALYEFVQGGPFSAGQIGWNEVSAALDFLGGLNTVDARTRARLPDAAEACFSIDEHLSLVGGRVAALAAAVALVPSESPVKGFVGALSDYFTRLAAGFPSRVRALGLDRRRPLDATQRCISPSDFGFHNALREPDGSIRFLDFEYAGWDDPAKATGDFFAQLAVPVPGEFFEPVVQRVMGWFPQSDELIARARLLRPVYQVKWCCIALNVYLPSHLDRRKFANPLLDETALKAGQLAKARSLLDQILHAQ